MSLEVYTLPLENYGANCYFLRDGENDEGAVIDPGAFSPAFLEMYGKSGIKKLRYILFTHGHFDHILGGARLKAMFPEASVAIGAADAPALSDSVLSLSARYGIEQEPLCADVLFHDGDTFGIGGTRFRVLSCPGHTAGGVSYICDSEEAAFTGDTLFCKTIGRTDFPGGSLSELLKSVLRLMELPDGYTVYPGHNRSTSIGAERNTNRYLRKL